MKKNLELVEETRSFIRENLFVKNSILLNSFSLSKKRSIQHFISLKPKKEIRKLYELVLGYALQSENSCPGTFVLVLERFCNIESKFQKIETKKDIKNYLSSNFSSITTSILESILDILNINTKISIKKSSSEKTYVEIIDGFVFECSSMLKIKNIEVKKLKIACIDGFIESVAEIHHLLSWASENQQAIALFCRGMSEDVLNTIKVNNERKTLQLYPYQVKFDLENVNTLVDIAVVSNCDVVSSLKGDLISSTSYKNLGSVESSILTETTVNLKNKKTKRIDDHLRYLKNLADERKEISDILSKRIKSMSSSYIEISIPEGIDYSYSSLELDEGIRIITSIINNSYTPEKSVDFYHASLSEYISNLDLHNLD